MSTTAPVHLTETSVSDVHIDSSYLCFGLMLLLSVAVSVGILSARNLYEDEVNSFLLIQQPIREIWRYANMTDIHPPGMYVLSHLFYCIIPSERWLTLGPLSMLYAALAFFVFQCRRLVAQNRLSQTVFFAIAFFSPQLLMWSNSLRWYPYWTSLALIALAQTLQVDVVGSGRELRPISMRRALLLGCLVGSMFYINYLTIFYTAALLLSYFVRYPFRPVVIYRAAQLALVSIVVSIPQVIPMLKAHMPNSSSQKASRLAALARLSDGITLSEAVLPWHPVGLLFLALVIIPVLWLCGRQLATFQTKTIVDALKVAQPVWPALMCFAAAFYGIGVISAAGAKARSFILLCPIAALLIARFIKATVWGYTQTAVIALWISIGLYHLITRQETTKGEFNDHGEQVVDLLQQQAGDKRALIFVHEPPLTFVLNRAASQRRWVVCSVADDYIHHIPAGSLNTGFIREGQQPEYVFVVQSYVGALHEQEQELKDALRAANGTIISPQRAFLSPDQDVVWKKRIPGMAAATRTMPNYRFIVNYGPAREGTYWRAIADKFHFYNPPEWKGIPAAQQALFRPYQSSLE